METPRLVIVGRPNVGKSTLFNRLLGRRRALVHDLPGVTRDRLEERAEWWFDRQAHNILLVDTGGLGGDFFADEIERQVQTALGHADVVILLFDGRVGITPGDEEILRKLRQAGVDRKIPLIGVVNKVDDESHEGMLADFYSSGLDPILTISASHGRGMDDLKDAVRAALLKRHPEWSGAPVVSASQTPKQADAAELAADAEAEAAAAEAHAGDDADSNSDADEFEEVAGTEEFLDESEIEELPDEEPETRANRIPRVALVGRPNVGKSTLTNALLDDERMITSPIAGTTIDSVDSAVELNGRPFILIDTAGIRRKSKTEQGVEVLSVVQARKALERCDVAILLLDGETGTIDQDEKIGGIIEEVGCSVILAVNKWDTQRGNREFTKEGAAERIRRTMPFLRYAPIMFTSAKRGEGFEDLGDLVHEILEQRRVKIGTKEFSEWIRKESEIHNPGNAKFYMSHQSGRYPPTFVCHVSDPDKVHFSLRRHFVNAMREKWGYMGSPIRIHFVKTNSRRR